LEDLGADRFARCALFLAAGTVDNIRGLEKPGRTDSKDPIDALGVR
jgi:hypothetical protein